MKLTQENKYIDSLKYFSTYDLYPVSAAEDCWMLDEALFHRPLERLQNPLPSSEEEMLKQFTFA